LLFAVAGSSQATPTVDFLEQWTASGSLAGWTNAAPYGTGNAVLTNSSGFLMLSFPAQGMPAVLADTMYGTGTQYSGSFALAQLAVRFNFLAEDALPSSSVLYMHAVSGREWTYAFDNPAVNVWTMQDVTFDYNFGAGWSGGSQAQFNSDLSAIDAIGIRINNRFDYTGQQDYGLDDWTYYIPEPGTVCLLASFFLCFGIVFRRRLPLIFAKPGA